LKLPTQGLRVVDLSRALSRQHQQQRLTFNSLWELPTGDEEAAAQPRKDDWITRIFGHIETTKRHEAIFAVA
jgi:hypothetical protein